MQIPLFIFFIKLIKIEKNLHMQIPLFIFFINLIKINKN